MLVHNAPDLDARKAHASQKKNVPTICVRHYCPKCGRCVLTMYDTRTLGFGTVHGAGYFASLSKLLPPIHPQKIKLYEMKLFHRVVQHRVFY